MTVACVNSLLHSIRREVILEFFRACNSSDDAIDSCLVILQGDRYLFLIGVNYTHLPLGYLRGRALFST